MIALRQPRPLSADATPAAAPRAAPGLVLLLGLTALIGGLAGFIATENDATRLGFDLAGASATLSLTLVFTLAYVESKNALSPICITTFVLFLLYPFHAWMTRDEVLPLELIGADHELWRARALLVCALSAPFMWLGFRSRLIPRLVARLPSPRWHVDDTSRATRSKILMLYVLGFAPRALALSAGQGLHWASPGESLGSVQFILSLLGNIPLLASAWALVIGVRDRNRLLLALGIGMVVGEVVWALASGSRLRIVLPIVIAGLAYSYVVKRVSLVRFGALMFTFLIIVLPFVTAFKTALMERSESLQREGLQAQTVIESLFDASDDEDRGSATDSGPDGPLEALAERFHGATSLALIMRFTPERHDYDLGLPYLLAVPQVLIPRVVWPDKPPANAFADIFRYDYWGMQRGDGTSVAVSQLGDLWVNLHLPGCIIGTFLFGAIVSVLFRHLRYGIGTASILPQIIFAAQLPSLLHALEGSFESLLISLPKWLLVYVLVVWFLAERRSGASAADLRASQPASRHGGPAR